MNLLLLKNYQNSPDLLVNLKQTGIAANADKEVALQYIDTIALKDADLEEKDDRIEKLEAELKRMQTV